MAKQGDGCGLCILPPGFQVSGDIFIPDDGYPGPTLPDSIYADQNRLAAEKAAWERYDRRRAIINAKKEK